MLTGSNGPRTGPPTSTSAGRLTIIAVLLTSVLAACSSSDGATSTAKRGADETVIDTAIIAEEPEPEASYSATIRRTEHGVPHIAAETLGSLAFGQGWASGEDHACSLARAIVTVRSEEALYFGAGENNAHLDSDFAWLHLGVYERAENASHSNEVMELFDGFVAGWNAHLDDVGPDAIAGWCTGADWLVPITSIDLLAYGHSIGLRASSGAVIDMIPSAMPPERSGDSDPTDPTPEPEPEPELAPEGDTALGPLVDPEEAGSNGWAIGTDRTEDGNAMLLANPHFPWEGPLRFWESHLTMPSEDGSGTIDAYGAQLLGLPGLGLGFNEHVAWTHTVSAGNRFTAYTLDLTPGSPTSYAYGSEVREMESTTHTVEVAGDDGNPTEASRTLWTSHYGPILDFPGLGWTDELVISIRDANIDNDVAFFEQYLEMPRARSLDELIEVHRTHTGVPLFNTVAAGADGTVWYADTSATPKLSDDTIDRWLVDRETDLITAIAADAGAVVLDGSDPANEWVEVEGARSPGLVPFDEMPATRRSDVVFNANDSFWVSSTEELLSGDYSPLHGFQDTARSVRTRENAEVLGTRAGSGAGDDGLFSAEELRAAALRNRSYTAATLRSDVVQRCRSVPVDNYPALDPITGDANGSPIRLDLTPVCDVLDDWDGRYDLDSAGPVIWREFSQRFDGDARSAIGPLWATDFDPADPYSTPGGLAPTGLGPDSGDSILHALAAALQTITLHGVAPGTPLGEVQFADRGEVRVPIHGGTGGDGITNVVGCCSTGFVEQGEPNASRGNRLVDGSDLTEDGYQVSSGTSFIMSVEFTDEGPDARALLTYGQTGDPDDPRFSDQTERFSDKDWRQVRFTDADIEADPALETYTVAN